MCRIFAHYTENVILQDYYLEDLLLGLVSPLECLHNQPRALGVFNVSSNLQKHSRECHIIIQHVARSI